MSFRKKLKKLLQKSVKVTSALGGNWAAVKTINDKEKAEQAKVAENAAASAAQTAAQTAAQLEEQRAARAAETQYRGSLIDAQRGGLASTILNLGGAAGDPDKPFASQLVGAQADRSADPTAESPVDLFRKKQKKRLELSL